MWCGVPELDRGLRDRSDPAPFLRGASTTTYASSKLNRVGRKAARYDSGLSAHKCTRPAHKRPTPHRIAVDCCAVPQDHLEQIACSRSRCGNSTPFTALFPPLPPVNPCQHPGSLPFAAPPPSRQHNHARYDLAGNPTSVTYPSGRTVNYTFDSASRPKTAADGSNGITYATDFQTPPSGCLSGAVCYTPQGTFYALSIGQSSAFTGLNLTHSYNNRLQPNEFKASSSGGNAIDITYSFVDPSTSKNAGHVYSITNNLDT